MSKPASRHELGGPSVRFTEGMTGSEIIEATATLDARQRIEFWSTFRSTTDLAFPSAVTSRAVDDVAAVVSGSKPATIIVRSDFDGDRRAAEELFDYLDEGSGRAEDLAFDEARDAYGGLKAFLGTPESVAVLTEQYEGRGGSDSPRPADEAFHRAVGEALGYPAEAIDAFVARTTAK